MSDQFPTEFTGCISNKQTLLFFTDKSDQGRIKYFTQALDNEEETMKSEDYEDSNVLPELQAPGSKPGLAAVAWTSSTGVHQVRIYFRDTNNKLVEYCRSSDNKKPNTFYRGVLTDQNIELDVEGALEAVVDAKTKQVKVFYVPKKHYTYIFYIGMDDYTGKGWTTRPVMKKKTTKN